MKRVKFFLLAISLLSSPPCVWAQSAEIYARQPADSGFFIPQQELQPRYERLPQIRVPQSAMSSAARAGANNQQQVQSQPRARKYIAVDGRYIPVIEKEDKAALKTEVTVGTDSAEEQTPPIKENIAISDVMTEDAANRTEEQIQSGTFEPVAEIQLLQPVPQPLSQEINPVQPQPAQPKAEVNSDLPNYRNAYGHYLNDLTIFRQTGDMPPNAELERTLSKLNSDEPIILYQEKP